VRSLKNIFRTEVDTSIEINNRKHTDKFILMGSCFSDEMFKYFSKFCFDILKPYGTIFNPITLSKNLEKAILNINFQEEDLLKTDELYLSWNHSGKYYNRYEKLLLKILNEEQQKINKFIENKADLIVTFGTATIYELTNNNTIVANWHKESQSLFVKRRLDVAEIVESWRSILNKIDNNIIFTVSPVRHVRDGLINNNLNKSILLIAINQLKQEFSNAHYFPSYELLMDELRDYRFYASDWIHPSLEATGFIWNKLSHQLFTADTLKIMEEINKIRNELNHQSKFGMTKQHMLFLEKTLKKISKIQAHTGQYDWSQEISNLKSQLNK